MSIVTAMVVLFAVHEHHHVRILLDRTRFAQVAQAWAVVLAFFRLTIELCEAQDWHVALHERVP